MPEMTISAEQGAKMSCMEAKAMIISRVTAGKTFWTGEPVWIISTAAEGKTSVSITSLTKDAT